MCVRASQRAAMAAASRVAKAKIHLVYVLVVYTKASVVLHFDTRDTPSSVPRDASCHKSLRNSKRQGKPPSSCGDPWLILNFQHAFVVNN